MNRMIKMLSVCAANEAIASCHANALMCRHVAQADCDAYEQNDCAAGEQNGETVVGVCVGGADPSRVSYSVAPVWLWLQLKKESFYQFNSHGGNKTETDINGSG